MRKNRIPQTEESRGVWQRKLMRLYADLLTSSSHQASLTHRINAALRQERWQTHTIHHEYAMTQEREECICYQKINCKHITILFICKTTYFLNGFSPPVLPPWGAKPSLLLDLNNITSCSLITTNQKNTSLVEMHRSDISIKQIHSVRKSSKVHHFMSFCLSFLTGVNLNPAGRSL